MTRTTKKSGQNKQGSYYSKESSSKSIGSSNSYHYSNKDGSYYYKNSNGSTFYENKNGYTYTKNSKKSK